MTSNRYRPGPAWIITPGLRADRFTSAQESGAAVAVVDIEDSIARADKDPTTSTGYSAESHAQSSSGPT